MSIRWLFECAIIFAGGFVVTERHENVFTRNVRPMPCLPIIFSCVVMYLLISTLNAHFFFAEKAHFARRFRELP